MEEEAHNLGKYLLEKLQLDLMGLIYMTIKILHTWIKSL